MKRSLKTPALLIFLLTTPAIYLSAGSDDERPATTPTVTASPRPTRETSPRPLGSSSLRSPSPKRTLNLPGLEQGIVISNTRFLKGLEFLVAALALLSPRETLWHLLGYQGLLGTISYVTTMRGGNPILAKKFAGHVGLATLLILLCNKILKTPIDFAVPAGAFYMLYKRDSGQTIAQLVAQLPSYLSSLSALSMSSTQVQAALGWVAKIITALSTSK